MLCGFSQGAFLSPRTSPEPSLTEDASAGGVMTLLQALTADSPNRFEAAVVFSTYLPIPNEIEDVRPLPSPFPSASPSLGSSNS